MSTLAVNAINAASGGTVTITGAALTTPALGTPASGNLANCTGLPASAVVNTPSGGISATTVQAALNELDSEKLDKSGGTISGNLLVGGNVWIIGSQLNVEPGAAQNFEIVNRVGGGFDFYVDNGTKFGARMNADSQSWYTNGVKKLELGGTGALALDSVGAAVGDAVLSLYRTGYGNTGVFYQCDTGSPNAASTALKLWSAASGRSISASGTINASGADAAEYRKNNGLTIAKGQIVGYKHDGTLTLTWSEATMARVKSTDPHIVGGDTWGTEDKIGKRPDEPKFTPPEYTGRDKPEGPAPEPQAPTFILTEPEHPGANASPVEAATYVLLKREYDVASDDHAKSVVAFEDAHAAWASLHEQHLRDMADWRTDQVEHETRVAVERDLFDTTIYPEYQRANAAFEARLEQARQEVDRIAYCGIVPCNVTGAAPGHYIVATEGPGDSIVGVSVRRPTEEQWSWVVGRCLRVLPDGRAEIDVMLS